MVIISILINTILIQLILLNPDNIFYGSGANSIHKPAEQYILQYYLILTTYFFRGLPLLKASV